MLGLWDLDYFYYSFFVFGWEEIGERLGWIELQSIYVNVRMFCLDIWCWFGLVGLAMSWRLEVGDGDGKYGEGDEKMVGFLKEVRWGK